LESSFKLNLSDLGLSHTVSHFISIFGVHFEYGNFPKIWHRDHPRHRPKPETASHGIVDRRVGIIEAVPVDTAKSEEERRLTDCTSLELGTWNLELGTELTPNLQSHTHTAVCTYQN
jgi:hypothetical protein